MAKRSSKPRRARARYGVRKAGIATGIGAIALLLHPAGAYASDYDNGITTVAPTGPYAHGQTVQVTFEPNLSDPPSGGWPSELRVWQCPPSGRPEDAANVSFACSDVGTVVIDFGDMKYHGSATIQKTVGEFQQETCTRNTASCSLDLTSETEYVGSYWFNVSSK